MWYFLLLLASILFIGCTENSEESGIERLDSIPAGSVSAIRIKSDKGDMLHVLDANGRISSVQIVDPAQRKIQGNEYTYDSQGRVKKVTVTDNAYTSRVRSSQYTEEYEYIGDSIAVRTTDGADVKVIARNNTSSDELTLTKIEKGEMSITTFIK